MNRPMMHLVDPHTGESDPAEIQRVFESQLATSLAWRQSTIAERIARLKRLRTAMMARREDFYAAFLKDYRKPSAEVEATEFMPVLDEIRHTIGHLKKWAQPKRVWPTMATAFTSSWIEYQPRGRVLIVAPWNFPLNLCFGPLVSALAAGNTAILKPSEMTPAVSTVMAEVIADVFTNCGQICVAPDHVYVQASVKDRFVAAAREVIAERFGATPEAQRQSTSFARVINQRHTQRIAGLLSDAQDKGAKVLAGGEVDVAACYIAPTLLEQVPASAAIMQDEIFGPVLPILTYTQLDEVVAQINAQPKPLALYVFSTNKARTRNLIERTSSGGVAINHCVLHYAHGNLPFGGVNNSGIGSAHGEFGFKAFSHERAVLKSGPVLMARMFFPPYTGLKQKLIRWTVDSLRLPSIF
jgi:acyl-CoA reductase-like NAD-dependent aldehyde dehydrogenase